MTVSANLLRLCPHTVQIAPFSSSNSYGEPSFGSDVAYTCLIEKKPRRVLGFDNKEIVSSVTVYLTSAPSISPRDRITLPDGSKPQILSFGTFPSKSGDYFTVVYC